MGDSVKKYFSPRLIDYVIFVGPRAVTIEHGDGRSSPSLGGHTHIPHLLRRYPPEDHRDFALPPDVVIFCQPEGCDHQESTPGSYNNPSTSSNSFVFLLTEKDTSRVRYGTCLNFYRPLQKCPSRTTNKDLKVNDENQSTNEIIDSKLNEVVVETFNDGSSLDDANSNKIAAMRASNKSRSTTPSGNNKNITKQKITYALHSICIISHHPFFSTFRECLIIIRKYIQACEDKNIIYHQQQNRPPVIDQTQIRCKCYHMHKHIAHHYRNTTGHRIDCPYSSPIWSLLTMPHIDERVFSPPTVLDDLVEFESWLLRFLSTPAPVPEKTKIELEIMPTDLKTPLLFALPDHTRFSLIDFPLHLPLELLGVQTCLQVLTCILLEHKVALQSKDYNALSMSVMAFVTMIYPLEYMFPVIPLLPSCMGSAEQLLLAPTPFIIGFPSSFFKFKCNFSLPNDVWIVDLDTNKVIKPPNVEPLPRLPPFECSILVQNLQKILNTMSGLDTSANLMPTDSELSTITTSNAAQDFAPSTPMRRPTLMPTSKIDENVSSSPSSPFKSRRSSMASAGQLLQMAANKLGGGHGTNSSASNASKIVSPPSSVRPSMVTVPNVPAFDPLTIIHNDADAVDVAVRIAMCRFFNSQEVLANFIEHTRTIRLYPRPVVSFQKSSFIQSRSNPSQFLMKLVETQAVEYMAEWALCPDNVAFQRIQTGVYDPHVIGDKSKWFGHQLDSLKYTIWDQEQKRDFYLEIVSLMKHTSENNILEDQLASTARFSDYYANEIEPATKLYEHEDLTQQLNDTSTLSSDPTQPMHHLVVGGGDNDHSPYISSNDSSPCYASDDDVDNMIGDKAHSHDKMGGANVRTLDDVMNLRLRSSSISSSLTSSESWNEDHMRQSIPPDFQHDIAEYPPLRCDLVKNFKPPTKLITSLDDEKVVTIVGDGKDSEKKSQTSKVQNSYISSDDDDDDEDDDDDDDDNDDSFKVAPSSSSCDDNSKTEEFEFDMNRPKTPDEQNDILDDGVVKLFESVDSDTMVPMKQTSSSSIDINNNIASTSSKMNSEEFGSTDNLSISSGIDINNNNINQLPISPASGVTTSPPGTTTATTLTSTSTTRDSLNADRKFSESFVTSDAVNLILNSQKAKVTKGMAKLIDRASSITESIKQNSSPSSNSTSVTKNSAGEPTKGTFIDKFKEARAAIDAGKNALKSSTTVADGGRQNLLKNIQEVLFEDKRDGTRKSSPSGDENTTINQEVQASRNQSGSNHHQTQANKQTTPDLNDITDKAASIGGWLGSKATGFANRMRDRAKPLGPFPQKYGQLHGHKNLTSVDVRLKEPSPNPTLRRFSLSNYRRGSISNSSFISPLKHPNFNKTIMEDILEADVDDSISFTGHKLVQKTRLIRHSTVMDDQKATPIRTTQSDGDNQQFLKDTTIGVMNGDGIGWLNLKRFKKLMEDESYRNLVLSIITKDAPKSRPDDKIGDVQISKDVWRGLIKVCLAIVYGLEQSYMHNKLIGMASVFTLLEIAHTHYWAKLCDGDHKQPSSSTKATKTTSTSQKNPSDLQVPTGDRQQGSVVSGHVPIEETDVSLSDESSSLKISHELFMVDDNHTTVSTPQSLEDQQNIMSRNSIDCKPSLTLQDLEKASKLVGASGDDSSRKSSNSQGSCATETVNHPIVWTPKQGMPQMDRATLSSGITLNSLNEYLRVYLYEGFIQRERSNLWDQLQFWEEAFLDAVSHERCLIGMDQGPSEMLERYKLLYEMDRKRLEHEEDILLSTLLYNMTAFMVMLQVDKQGIKQKIRRLLGKCHIGLVNSVEINQLLEQIDTMRGNDIDLKQVASRQLRRQTFTLNRGTDHKGPIIFMEVRDDGLILRGLDGVVIERWWYERLINMTYSPKNKIVCFWRKAEGETKLDKFHTKKCHELYNAIKESMQKVASSRGEARICSELGGEFPVLDMKSGEGGILQVCLEGVGLLFATSKYFVNLENIRKCFTQKGGTFVLEEYNPKSRVLTQRFFKSQMADQICYSILCVFSYVAAGQNKKNPLAADDTKPMIAKTDNNQRPE